MAKLTDVNTTSIADAIRLGCQTMCNLFNADDDDIPFFRAAFVPPEASLSFSWAHSEAHVPGRHLNGLLSAERVIGIPIAEACIDKHARAAFFSYSGPVPLPLNRDVIGGPLVHFLPHNVREGFHALYTLAKYRDSARARQLAEASIAAILKYWDPAQGWDRARLEALGLKVTLQETFIAGLARAIGPLVKYYRATGYGPALELAIGLKEKAIAEVFTPDGTYDRDAFGTHGHSTTCVMSSLAQLADLTRDAFLMSRVRAFYDNGLWEIRDELGWVLESDRPDAHPDRGEGNNTGDIVETALILGRWGYTEGYADAERILRGHLLPSQLRDISFLKAPPNPEGADGKRDVPNRLRGSFGIPAPYGHWPLGCETICFNTDIVGGAVGSLCEAYREVTRFDAVGHRVNLLFDHETDAIQVESPYTHPALRVRIKRPGPLFVRVPPWADAERVVIRGTTETAHHTNGYLFLAKPPINRPIAFEFPLVEQELTLKHRTREIRVRLQGDEVIAMDNFGAELTFFDPIA
jgi:hypothetical protein